MSLSKVSAKSSREPYKDMQVLPSLSFDAIHHLILQFQWDSLVLEEDEQRVRVGLRLPPRLWTHWVPALPQHHKPHVMMQSREIPFFGCLPFQALRLSQPQLEPPLHAEWRDSAKILDGRGNLDENIYWTFCLFHRWRRPTPHQATQTYPTYLHCQVQWGGSTRTTCSFQSQRWDLKVGILKMFSSLGWGLQRLGGRHRCCQYLLWQGDCHG